MPCNCGKKPATNRKVRWAYTDSKGVERIYTSEAAARAAYIRDDRQGNLHTVSA